MLELQINMVTATETEERETEGLAETAQQTNQAENIISNYETAG